MNPGLAYGLAFAAGVLLAAAYLGGLWLTVTRVQVSRNPLVWLATSLAARLGLLVVAFYYILGDGHWQRLLVALAGFLVVRAVAIRRIGSRRRAPAGQQKSPA